MERGNAMRQREAADLVKQFRKDFCDKFGILPRVIYNIESMAIHTASLETYLQVGNELVAKHVLDRDAPEGIKTKSRHGDIVMIRNLLIFLAIDDGYTVQELADLLEFKHHTSSMHADKRIEELLETRDAKTLKFHAEFYTRIKELNEQSENN